ncbi:hypothetical protein M405DRAFT_885635 [Rhizopogon salebrosus TDB-379]|nr:hypothetical protein M405DRAFT_885635 [Rhizopogon salebrosus TDB-379]
MILWSHGLVTIIMARTAIGIYLVLQLLSLIFLTKNHHMILRRGSVETPSMANGRWNRSSSSTPSLVESFSPEKRAKAERRRKPGPSLPPTSMPEDGRDMWLHRRMSGPSALSFNRVEEELDDEEKVLNVRRAQKMEKLFGIPPPQTLYHTCHAPTTVARSQPTSPVSSVMIPHYLSDDGPRPGCDPNQSAYTKGKKTHRPGTSESTTFNIPPPKPERDWRQSDMIRRVMFIRTCMQGPPIPDRFLWQIPDDEHGRRRLLDGVVGEVGGDLPLFRAVFGSCGNLNVFLTEEMRSKSGDCIAYAHVFP